MRWVGYKKKKKKKKKFPDSTFLPDREIYLFMLETEHIVKWSGAERNDV